MLKVDTIYGNDDNSECFKTLEKAIEISKSGDSISLMPGTYDSFQVRSKTTNFELKITGSGSNTVCSNSNFDGFFDITYENLKVDICNINSSSSNFIYRDVKFVSMNTMTLSGYENTLSENPRTFIVFDKCTFGYNFQIILLSGIYVISFKNCNISGKIPLIFAKKGELVVKISNTDFETPILHNKNSIVEIQHTCCNFTCPIYQGNECLVYTKDNFYNSTPEIKERSVSLIGYMSSEPIESLKSGTDDNYEAELYAAIMMNSDDYDELRIHRYTKLVVNKGKKLLSLSLPKETSNGHILMIYSDSEVEVDFDVYDERIIKMAWIYNYGWIKLPIS